MLTGGVGERVAADLVERHVSRRRPGESKHPSYRESPNQPPCGTAVEDSHVPDDIPRVKRVWGEGGPSRPRRPREIATGLAAGSNLIVTGPRRSGETSVCDAALVRLGRRGFYTVSVDLFRIASAAEFAEALAAEQSRTAIQAIARRLTCVKSGAWCAKYDVSMKTGRDARLRIAAVERLSRRPSAL